LEFEISRRLLGERIDSFGKTKIKLGQAAFAVGRKNQTDFIVTNVDVWMVFFFVCHFGHCVYEIDRIGKIIELKRAFDVLLLQFPLRDFFHSLLELALFDEVCHNGTTSNTRKSFCNAKTSGSFFAAQTGLFLSRQGGELPEKILKD